MPVVTVEREEFMKYLGKQMTDKEFEDLCFQFGLQLDDIFQDPDNQNTIKYKIEVAANRYDLLCLQGLSDALKVFMGSMQPPHFKLSPEEPLITVNVAEPTRLIRPEFIGAVLRGVTFTPSSLRSFLDLQDKLHQNICRGRKLVSVGTHDLDTIQPPFLYTAQPASEIKFRPLFMDQEMTAEEIFQHHRQNNKMKKYVRLVQKSPVIPIIYDSNGVVLSMPPLINSFHSQLTVNTKNVFIDCTALDLNKAQIVVNTLIAAISGYCQQPFTAEPVKLVFPNSQRTFPTFEQKEFEVNTQYVNRIVGIEITTDQACDFVTKMGLRAKKLNEDRFHVVAPITRSDILHACDVAQDIAIAYGYNNVPSRYPKTNTIGKQFELNALSDLVRREAANGGYVQALTFTMLSLKDAYENMRKEEDGKAVLIANPRSADFQLPRFSLIPGLLKTVSSNQIQQLPLKFFELSDVVVKNDESETGAKNNRRLAAAYCYTSGELEELNSLLDHVFLKVGLGFESEYELQESDDASFFPGRQASVVVKGESVGIFGLIHPEVLENFNIKYPVVCFEVDLERLLSLSNI